MFNPRTCPVNISLAATQTLGARQKQAPAVYRAARSIMNYRWEALRSPLNYAQVDSDSSPPGFLSAGSSKAKSEPLFQTKGRGKPLPRIQIKIFAGSWICDPHLLVLDPFPGHMQSQKLSPASERIGPASVSLLPFPLATEATVAGVFLLPSARQQLMLP